MLRVFALKKTSKTSPTNGMAPERRVEQDVRRHASGHRARHAIMIHGGQDDPRLDQPRQDVAPDRQQTEQGIEPDRDPRPRDRDRTVHQPGELLQAARSHRAASTRFQRRLERWSLHGKTRKGAVSRICRACETTRRELMAQIGVFPLPGSLRNQADRRISPSTAGHVAARRPDSSNTGRLRIEDFLL